MKFRFAMPALALVAGLLSLTPAHADTTSADYKTGYNLGHLAFEYGIPLMDMQRVYATQTSINVSDSSGDGPVNQFSSVPHLIVPTPSQKTVVAPNADTLYSIAWLDLSKQAQVIHVPAIKGRFYSVSLYTPWTENFFNITSLAGTDKFGAYRVTSGGNFVVTPPGFRGKVPTGVRRIASPYKRVWIIVRTLIRGKEDTAAVNKIQRGYGLKPLSAYGHPFTAPRPRRPVTALRYATVPGTQPGQDPLAFYVALNRELIRFAPMSQDGPLLAQLKQIDVGPGLNPANDSHLSADMLAGMRAAVTDGPANIQSELKNLFLTTGSAHNWYFVVRTGTYGTDYQRRAIVDVKGLGAPRSNISVYPFTQNNLVVAPLSGSSSYVLHIPAGQLPPVQAFWSLTMYDTAGFFIPNPLGRYVLNDRSGLSRNADGSIDIYIQRGAPTNPTQLKNWLPAPAGDFRIMWRLYGTGSALEGILDGSGWKPPTIQTCVAGIGVPGLTACAH